jgi:hypothetical protein
MQNTVREFQPFGCHFAVNSAIILGFYYRYQVQAMLGVTGVFFVLVVLGNCHDHLPLPALRLNLRPDAGVSLCKIEHLLRRLEQAKRSRVSKDTVAKRTAHRTNKRTEKFCVLSENVLEHHDSANKIENR